MCWQKADPLLLFPFFFLSVWCFYTGGPLMACQLKKASANKRTCTSTLCVASTSSERCSGVAWQADGRPPPRGTMARSLPLARSGSLRAAGTGPGAAWFPAEVKSTGAVIIMALMRINRERSEEEDGARPTVWARITRTAGAFLKDESGKQG